MFIWGTALFLLGVFLFFWAFIHYMVYRAFHFSAIPEQKKPDIQIFNKYYETLILTDNGKQIQIYDLNPESSANVVVVAIHGWANTSEIFLPMAQEISKFTRFFMVNARNHGGSDQERLMNILKFESDLRHAIDYALSTVKKKKGLIVVGHSLGAAASILAAGDDERVDGVISISSFADVRQIMFSGFLQKKVPVWLIKIVLKYIEWKIGRPYDEISPVRVISRFHKPTLLIHGSKDTLVPKEDMEIIFRSAKRDNVETYLAEGHSHSSLLKDPEVIRVIKNFIGKYFVKS